MYCHDADPLRAELFGVLHWGVDCTEVRSTLEEAGTRYGASRYSRDNSGGEDAREQAWKYVTTSSLLFLVGSVFSFAVAVACGLLLNPDALKVWAAHSR